jgi:hypothetical protein
VVKRIKIVTNIENIVRKGRIKTKKKRARKWRMREKKSEKDKYEEGQEE